MIPSESAPRNEEPDEATEEDIPAVMFEVRIARARDIGRKENGKAGEQDEVSWRCGGLVA